MVSLLARLPRTGRDGGHGWRAVPLIGLAAVAAVVVSVVGLAGLGLAVVVVQTLDPEGGLALSGSLALAGRLWLLAQGGGLELPSGPLVLAPLLLTLVIAWGLSQAGRGVVRAHDVAGPRAAVRVVAVIAGVHLLASGLLGWGLDTPGAGVEPVRTAVATALFAVLAAGWGVGRETGLLDAGLGRLPGPARPLLRGVLAGLLTALGLCTAVVAVALAADASGYAVLSGRLGGAAAGALGLLVLGLLLLPNAAVAVLGLAAGPGFFIGTGTLISVHGVTLSAVPALPLLAALPDTQAVPLIAFASQAVPALAGLVTGATVGRHFTDPDGGVVVAGLTGLLAGLALGAAGGLLAWVAGGSLGDGAMAVVGAPPVATGLALAAQGGIAAAVAATVSRWRSRA